MIYTIIDTYKSYFIEIMDCTSHGSYKLWFIQGNIRKHYGSYKLWFSFFTHTKMHLYLL